jgi:SAM-dependent methyltransferase
MRWTYTLTHLVHRTPGVGSLTRRVVQMVRNRRFKGSATYWDSTYRTGGNSGPGSYGRLAEFKAEVLNGFVERNAVKTVIELGCGDGAQLARARYPGYVGVDVSPSAIALCQERFAGDPSKQFFLLGATDGYAGAHDLVLSLDVIFHLIEDAAFDRYMRDLFALADRYVIIYASNVDRAPMGHVRHRRFTDWIEANATAWIQIDFIKNRYPFDPRRRDDTSYADFHVFGRRKPI